jgi:hypothetical protein
MLHGGRLLVAIALGAAVAGWLVVRLLGGDAPDAGRVEVARETHPEVATPGEREARPGATAEPPAVGGESEPEAGEHATIARDLDALEWALRRDVGLEDWLIPEDTTVLHLPNVIVYLRAPEFWQPAFAAGARRARR